MKLNVTGVFKRNWDAIHGKNEDGSRRYKYIINKGSSRSSKTYSLIDCFDLYARNNSNKRLTAWRETKKDCKDTLWNDFIKRLRETERYNDRAYNKTETIYQYKSGSRIEARGTDDESVFGLTQDCAWLNEPYSISKTIFDQIDQRTSDFIFIDWNPKQDHWIDDLEKHERALVIQSTFLDNPFCPNESRIKLLSYEPLPDELKYLKNEPIENVPSEYHNAWHNEKNHTAHRFNWEVYGLGIKGEVEGKVFSNYEIIDELPIDAKFYGFGMDYGYSNDPTTIIGLYEFNGLPIAHEVICSSGLKLTPLADLMKEKGIKPTDLIIIDKSAPLIRDEIYDRGFTNIHSASRGVDTIVYGIDKMKDYKIQITKQSTNLIREFENYKNAKNKQGKYLNEPEKNQSDHCFIGSTLITTNKGLVQIKDIKVNDLVLTRQGYKKVLKVWNNGVKKVNNYLMQLDIYNVSLTATNNHLISTNNEWTQISQLQKGQTVNLFSISTENHLNYKKARDISTMVQKKCTPMFGSSTMVNPKKATMYTIKTKIRTIIGLIILNLKRQINIWQSMGKKDMQKIPNGQKNFSKKELRQPLYGINPKQGLNGISNMQRSLNLVLLNMGQKIVKYVKKNLLKKQQLQNSVLINAKASIEEIKGSTMKIENAVNVSQHILQTNIQKGKIVSIAIGKEYEDNVYDLMIEDCHEYFANGLLVHNCIDGLRYVFVDKYTQPDIFFM